MTSSFRIHTKVVGIWIQLERRNQNRDPSDVVAAPSIATGQSGDETCMLMKQETSHRAADWCLINKLSGHQTSYQYTIADLRLDDTNIV